LGKLPSYIPTPDASAFYPPVICLLRHAESAPTPDTPEPDWPPSETGEKQARALAERLAGRRIDAVYSSPYRRAMARVRPLARVRDLEIRTDDRLRERQLTDQWLDDHQAAVRRVWADVDLALPGEESSAAAQKRVVAAVDDLQTRHEREERVLVSFHGNAIGLYLNHLSSGFRFEDWSEMQTPYLYAIRDGRGRRINL
jgi:2,3-bisphosphoglycerate-dependent phosphoglycerate mutase